MYISILEKSHQHLNRYSAEDTWRPQRELLEQETILYRLHPQSLQVVSPYLVHVGVKLGPILKVDLHCWVHGEA